MADPSFLRSPCPIAATLDLVGDRWTMVVMRDLFVGKARYQDFLESPEGISTNILAERLKRLEQAGLVTRRAYQTRPLRHEYELTEKGEAFLPVLQAMCRWGNRFLEGSWVPPDSFMNRKVS